jgi:cell division protein FtsZ
MTINLQMPEIKELRPKITVFGVGGAGGNAVNNMINSGLEGCEFVVANTDSQALTSSKAERMIQMGVAVTEGLGAGSQPEVGRAAAEEAIDEIVDHLAGSHMVFVTAGMGGGTGTGAAPIIARAAREQGILTVGVVTKPFQFEGGRRLRVADAGIKELQAVVDTLIVIPNQNLFRIANEKTTFADAFAMADQVLYSGVACITDLMVKEGLINLDFADVRSVMREMGKAMMGTGEASGDRRAIQAAEAAIANPLLDETSMRGARGLLISITGGKDLTLFEVDEAATRIREEVDPDANIILGATFDESLEGIIRCSVVATGIESVVLEDNAPGEGTSAGMNEAINSEAAGAGMAPGVTQFRSPAPAPSIVRPAAQVAPTPRVSEPVAVSPVSGQGQASTPEPEQAFGDEMAAALTAEIKRQSDPSDITLEPFDPGPIRYAQAEIDSEPKAPEETEHVSADAPFIAPAPDVPPQKMPRVEDFPAVAQRQMEAHQQGGKAVEPDRGPLGLLRRLASVGLGRREEESAGEAPAPRAAAAPQARAQPGAETATPRGEYAKRPPQPRAATSKGLYRASQGDLDLHGRQSPNDPHSAEEELEIPAFLRRQA